ncbi:MAG TPA: dTDP-4-dehydrorhamnose 3,5-epimerase [Gammaproteobacteria bacterium]|nr:dTDP-4-dehydrorhamnose 3,5-epimerase [Gammaproteobacteria bacterium]
MNFLPTKIPDVILVEPRVFGDERGYFMETWEQRKFAAAGINAEFVQDNHSRSVRGTLRGLHYQIEQPQGKLVRVVGGEVYDVVVDIRRTSPTFGQWVAETLSADNKKMLWVPPGCAHGFLVTSDAADFIYKCTDFYAPQHERCIRWDDPDLNIDWPLNGQTPLVSDKDRKGARFTDAGTYK